MAFGTPTVGTRAYSTLNATSIAPPYPAGIAANDIVVLFIGMKPSTANGGTVTTPTGWTLRDSITGQGGYGTTLGADTGNTNLYVFTKDNVTGTETGNLTVTLGTNNISWAVIVRVPGGGATSERFGTADGGRATAPTANVAFTNLLTNGTTAPDISAGDMVLFAMCCPTDAPAGGSFSAQTISSAGTTFATPVELAELFSATGNDISGYVAYASATSGSSTAAPTIGATVSGTVTNIRGPLVLISIRDTSQKLTPDRFDNTNSFFSPTVITGARNLAPALYTNTNTFYTPDVTQSGGGQTLTPALYTNTNTFFAQTLTSLNTLASARFDNANAIYGAETVAGYALSAGRFDNPNALYSVDVTAASALVADAFANANQFGAASVSSLTELQAGRLENSAAFFAADITQGATLRPGLLVNLGEFGAASVGAAYGLAADRLDNANEFYGPAITGSESLEPARLDNASVFHAATVSAANFIELGDYAEAGFVAPGYIGLALQSENTFYALTASYPQALELELTVNTAQFYPALIGAGVRELDVPFLADAAAFYGATLEQGQPRQNLSAALLANENQFGPVAVTAEAKILPAMATNKAAFFEIRLRGRPYRTALHEGGSISARPANVNLIARPDTQAGSRARATGGKRPANVSRGAR